MSAFSCTLIVKCFSSGLSIVFLRFILTGYAANQPMMNLSQRNMPFIGISLVYELKKHTSTHADYCCCGQMHILQHIYNYRKMCYSITVFWNFSFLQVNN